MAFKLGKLAHVHDPRTLKLTDYLAPLDALPTPPQSLNWGSVVPGDAWGMMLNDELGDCTIAAAGHFILMATAQHGKPFTISNAQALQAYKDVSGYNGDPTTDNGACEIDVLKYWSSFGIGGHKIGTYLSVPLGDSAFLRIAMYLFGALYTGVQLPTKAMQQLATADNPNGIWVPVPNDTIEGGHALPLFGYDLHAFGCVTWGQPQWGTDDWWMKYLDEVWVFVSEDWSPPAGVAPNSFDMNALLADLATIKKGASA